MINYFYNIILKTDSCDLYSDVLTGVRKDYYVSQEKQKGKITQNSSGNTLFYEFVLEKEKGIKWQVSNAESIISDSKHTQDGKSCVNFYGDNGLYKVITFSKFHTLLKVEYYNLTKSNEPYCAIEPRKSGNGLCLLLTSREKVKPSVLFPMPDIDDDYILDKIELEFDEYTVVASTNEGVVKFLSESQLADFEDFVDRAMAMKLTDTAPESYIDDRDAVLARRLNPKDFNVKRNLSQVVDISQAQEFMFDNIEDELASAFVDEYENDYSIDEAHDCVVESQDEVVVADEHIFNVVTNAEPEVQAQNIVEPQEDVVETSAFEDSIADEAEVVPSDEIVNNTSDETVEEIEQVVEPVMACVDDDISVVDNVVADPVVSDDIVTEVVESISDFCDTPDSDELVDNADVSDVTVEDETKITSCEPDDRQDEFELSFYGDPDRFIESVNTKYLYYGDLDDNGLRCGFGRTATEDGRTAYEGEYTDNKRNGMGAYYYKDTKLCYYGEWKNNKRDGFGVGVSSVDNSVHVGKFADNKPVGDGVRVDSSGEIKLVRKVLSNSVTVELSFDGDKIIVSKYDENGELISENTSNLMYF